MATIRTDRAGRRRMTLSWTGNKYKEFEKALETYKKTGDAVAYINEAVRLMLQEPNAVRPSPKLQERQQEPGAYLSQETRQNLKRKYTL